MKETFFAAFFSLSHLSFTLKDKFFRQKLIEKTKELFDNHVVQSVDNKLTTQKITELNEFIDILIHLKLTPLSPALLAQKNLLHLHSEILDSASSKPKTEAVKEKGKFVINTNKYYKEKIIAYLKTKPTGAQIKELSSFFSSQFSSRTLQRYLHYLVKEDLVIKNKDGGFPKYSLIH